MPERARLVQRPVDPQRASQCASVVVVGQECRRTDFQPVDQLLALWLARLDQGGSDQVSPQRVQVFHTSSGWWARIKKHGWFMERGPYRFKWMARMAFPIQRWTW
jgi:hypothetical protein